MSSTPPVPDTHPATADLTFPEGFGWGVATAAYQNEGAVAEDGRSPSIWDTFAHTPAMIADDSDGDVACDHYHRYQEDADLMAELGLSFYRFSVAWSRVQPDGRGELNQAGIDFYARLVESLLERDIEPWLTLYHWDLPQVLQDAGGWPERETALRFAEYSGKVYERLHDRVRFWTTLNEPWVSAFIGHAQGTHAPGIRDPAAALRAAHHLLLGHGLAINAMRAEGDPRSQFGITLILQPVMAATTDPPDIDAARRLDLAANRMWLDPIFRGSYPDDFGKHEAALIDDGYIREGDAALIAAPIDVLGVNYYFRHSVRRGRGGDRSVAYVGCEDVELLSRGLQRTAMGWEVDAEGLYQLLTRIKREYTDVPLYVTESGAAFVDNAPHGGALSDPDRIAYLDAHFRASHRAISDGVDLRGYFVWTLMDNFEWSFGYSKKFGLYHVDLETQERTPKDSAHWFAGVTRRNGLRH